MSKVIVAGGGVIGLCAAYYMRKSGHEVIVIDQGDLKQGTSFGNAGYICPSHFIPLASPGIVAKGLQWMLSSTSPFYIKPRLDMDLIKWGLTFWKRSGKSTMERNAPHLNTILQLSRSLTADLRDDLGNQFHMEEKGCLMLYKSSTTEKHEIEMAHDAAAFNIQTQILSAKEVQELEPDVKVDVRGGVLYPMDAHLNPGELMSTLYAHLEKEGVHFHLGTELLGFEKNGRKVTKVLTNKGAIDGDEVVIATGSWLSEMLKDLEIDVLLQAGKGYSMTFDNMSQNLHYPSILVDDRVAMTPMGSSLRMGGTMEISGIGSKMLVKRVQSIYKAAKNYFPDLPVSFPSTDKVWHGLRPLSPDGLPYIGKHSKYDNLVIAGGHGMLGISLAAGTGKLIDDIVSGHKLSMNIDAFGVER